jgi:hypothetical protein
VLLLTLLFKAYFIPLVVSGSVGFPNNDALLLHVSHVGFNVVFLFEIVPSHLQ